MSLAAALPSARALVSVSLVAVRATEPASASTVVPSVIVAMDSDTAMFAARAAPTLTDPSLVLAFVSFDGRLPLEEPVWLPAELVSWPIRPSALSCCCPGAFCAEPRAPPVASAEESDNICASTVAPPVSDVTSRSTSAIARSTSTVRPSATPTPTSLPVASADALVAAEPVWSALTDRSPSMAIGSPLGSCARVWFTPTVVATTGLTPTVPPAPASAVVLSACSPVALRVSESAPVSVAPPSISARAVFTPTLTARDPPTPTFVLPEPELPSPVPLPPLVPPPVPVPVPEPVDCAIAWAVDSTVASVRFSAVRVTSPGVSSYPAFTSACSVTTASLLVTPTFRAKAPAMPASPPLAPEIAVAPETCLPSGSRSSITASTVRP